MSNTTLFDLEVQNFRRWVLNQHSPQETMRMVSGCYINAVDSLEMLLWKNQNSIANNFSLQYAPKMNKKLTAILKRLSETNSFWKSIVDFRRHLASDSQKICLRNPTFDSFNQSLLSDKMVKMIHLQATGYLNSNIDYVAILERWSDSIKLLSVMFGVPMSTLNIESKVRNFRLVLVLQRI